MYMYGIMVHHYDRETRKARIESSNTEIQLGLQCLYMQKKLKKERGHDDGDIYSTLKHCSRASVSMT